MESRPLTRREWWCASAIAAYLLIVGIIAVSVLLSTFPETTRRLEAVPAGQPADDDAATPVLVDVEFDFNTVHILWIELGTPSAALGMFLLALVAGALGSVLHAAQSLAAFVGNWRFRTQWTIWYALRVPIGALLGLFFFALLRAGLMTADSEATSPFGVVALAGLGGMCARKALDKLREVFDTLFPTEQREKDPLVLHEDLAAIVGITPSPVPNVTSEAGEVELTIQVDRDVDEVTSLRIDGETVPAAPSEGSGFAAKLDEAIRRKFAGRTTKITLIGTPEQIPRTRSADLPFAS